jgi:hypothetical protein
MSGTYVYFLQPVVGGPVKIGCSYLPEHRLQMMMAWSPYPLKLLARHPGTMELERSLHRQFAAARRHGEWFDPVPELMALVERIAAGATLEMPEDELVYGNVNCWRIESLLPGILDRAGIQRKQLAEAIGVTPTTVSVWCRHGVTQKHFGPLRDYLASRGVEIRASDLWRELTDKEYAAKRRASEKRWRARAERRRARESAAQAAE